MQAIVQYPEFILAAVLSVLMLLRTNSRAEAESTGPSVIPIGPMRYQQWLLQNLTWAAERENGDITRFARMKLYLPLLGLLSCLWFGVFGILVVVVLFFFPDAFLLMKVQRRQQEIRSSLPQALDLMVMCVDAGLGLEGTVQRVSLDRSAVSPALQEELSILSRDILLGMDRAAAYQDLYARTGVEELKMLGSTFNQSTKVGLSISRMLRAQADFVRSSLTQKSEERAMKLPVWMALPLWFCVMPAVFILTVAPAFIAFLLQSGHVRPDWFN